MRLSGVVQRPVVLNPAEVVNIPVPEGKPRCLVRIAVAGRIVTADLNAKSVRRAIANIRQGGLDNVSCQCRPNLSLLLRSKMSLI